MSADHVNAVLRAVHAAARADAAHAPAYTWVTTHARALAAAPELADVLRDFVDENDADGRHPADCACTTDGGCPVRTAAALLARIDGGAR